MIDIDQEILMNGLGIYEGRGMLGRKLNSSNKVSLTPSSQRVHIPPRFYKYHVMYSRGE